MKSGYNQTYTETKEKGVNTFKDTADADCHA